MRKNGFSAVLLLIFASLAITGIIVASFVTLKNQGYRTKAEPLNNFPTALPGSQVQVEIDKLEPIDVAALLDDPQVSKLGMKNYHGDLEIDAFRTGTDSASRGKAAKVQLPGEVEITAGKNNLELSSKGVKAMTALPIIYNKNTGQLSADAVDGQKFIRILPNQAVEAGQAAVKISLSRLEITPAENGNPGDKLVYRVAGKRTGNLLGIYPAEGEVEIIVGAQSGLVLEIKEPINTRLFFP